MKYNQSRMIGFLQELRSLGVALPDWFWSIPMSDRLADCNGIGSDDPSVKWLVAPTTFVFSWMEVAATFHDEGWAHWFNDGSRERFELTNDLFREILFAKADRSFRWVWPGFLRERLRAGRRDEARAAHAILMSNGCFDIWRKNASVEPGPEVMA